VRYRLRVAAVREVARSALWSRWAALLLLASLGALALLVLRGEAFEGAALDAAPPQHDYYKVLGVARGADAAEIKRAFRRQSLRYHADKCGGAECAREFLLVSEAYEVLRDPQRRAVYDELEVVAAGALRSAAAELTADNFERLVLSGDREAPWVIQVYTEWHRSARSFAQSECRAAPRRACR
jgi:hypothetical protein